MNTLDIEDLEGIYENAKYYGTLEQFITDFENNKLVKIVYDKQEIYLQTGYIQRFKQNKK